MRADTELRAEVGQGRRIFRASVDAAAGALDHLYLRVLSGRCSRPAAAAWAKAGALGRFRQEEEADLLLAGPPGRAGRPTVDAGGADGVDEGAVEAGIAGEHGLPARIFL